MAHPQVAVFAKVSCAWGDVKRNDRKLVPWPDAPNGVTAVDPVLAPVVLIGIARRVKVRGKDAQVVDGAYFALATVNVDRSPLDPHLANRPAVFRRTTLRLKHGRTLRHKAAVPRVDQGDLLGGLVAVRKRAKDADIDVAHW